MSQAPPPEPPPPSEIDSDPARRPLDHVVDDDTPKVEAIEWAVEALYHDRPFEDVEAELVAGGWGGDAAAEVVEAARRRTRSHRGALTGEEVAQQARRYYRQSMTGGWFVGMPMLAAVRRLMFSVSSLLALRRAKGDGGRNAPPGRGP